MLEMSINVRYAYNVSKYCQRHNGLRLLSLKLELSLQLKWIQIPVSALLAFLHFLGATFSTLCTSLSAYSSTTISMTNITSPMAQQPILSLTWSQTPAPIFHATPALPCRPPCWPPSQHWQLTAPSLSKWRTLPQTALVALGVGDVHFS